MTEDDDSFDDPMYGWDVEHPILSSLLLGLGILVIIGIAVLIHMWKGPA